MTRFIAFLRAINVGGHTVAMADLRGHFESLGLSKVETFIASGNVIFESKLREKPLCAAIEARLLKVLGYEVAVFLRTDAEVQDIAACPPFSEAAMASAGAMVVGFLQEEMAAGSKAKLMALRSDLDDFRVHGREFHWLCQVGQSGSEFSNARFERFLGLKSTFRSLSTVRKLAAKYPPRTEA